MATLQQRLKRIEEGLGIKGPRYVLVIGCTDHDPEKLRVICYGEPLSDRELEEIRADYIRRNPQCDADD